jgi:phage/plasmid-like protein (TIGR03299 family)
MTAPTIDVNKAFNTERLNWINGADARLADANAQVDARNASIDARVADGRLVPLGGGRFKVNEQGSWDNGEIWQYQKNVNGLTEIMPQHGLDESKGFAALYSAVPAWHGLGTVIPGGITDVNEVMRLGGLDFEVAKQQATFTWKGKQHNMANRFDLIRADNGLGLANVGTRYTVMQNQSSFQFLQELVNKYDVTWESAGALREGRRVFISMKLPETIIIDPDGINDEIIPFIVAVNSHDGSTMFQVVVTPWRPVCGNTERFALRDATARWGVRHTTNAAKRIEEARNTLGLSVKYYDEFAREENLLAQTDVEIAEFLKVVEDLWKTPDDDAAKRTHTTHRQRIEALTNRWEDNTDRLGRTGYAAERAITEYLDWDQTVRGTGSLKGKGLATRATAMVEGASDDIKSKAHKQLLLRTVR